MRGCEALADQIQLLPDLQRMPFAAGVLRIAELPEVEVPGLQRGPRRRQRRNQYFNGFRGSFLGISPWDCFDKLLEGPLEGTARRLSSKTLFALEVVREDPPVRVSLVFALRVGTQNIKQMKEIVIL